MEMKKNYDIELSDELSLIVRYASRFCCPTIEGLTALEKDMYSSKIMDLVDKLSNEKLEWLYNEYSKFLESINRLYEILKRYDSSSKEERNNYDNAYRDSNNPLLDEEAQKSLLYVYEEIEEVLKINAPTYNSAKQIFEFMNIFQNSFRNLIDKKMQMGKDNNIIQSTENGYIQGGEHYHYPNFNDEERHIQLK